MRSMDLFGGQLPEHKKPKAIIQKAFGEVEAGVENVSGIVAPKVPQDVLGGDIHTQWAYLDAVAAAYREVGALDEVEEEQEGTSELASSLDLDVAQNVLRKHKRKVDGREKISDGPAWVKTCSKWEDDPEPVELWQENEILELMEALLFQTLRDAVDCHAGIQFRMEAIDWVMQTRCEDQFGNDWPFSFENIVLCLGLDPEEMREQFVLECLSFFKRHPEHAL